MNLYKFGFFLRFVFLICCKCNDFSAHDLHSGKKYFNLLQFLYFLLLTSFKVDRYINLIINEIYSKNSLKILPSK